MRTGSGHRPGDGSVAAEFEEQQEGEDGRGTCQGRGHPSAEPLKLGKDFE